jgi:predicted phosphodiesterase
MADTSRARKIIAKAVDFFSGIDFHRGKDRTLVDIFPPPLLMRIGESPRYVPGMTKIEFPEYLEFETPARFAALSDIHGNLEALIAVLADLDRRGIRDIKVLGDIVGYGPNPRECIDELHRWGVVSTAGNHDSVVIAREEDIPDYRLNRVARGAALYTKDCLGISDKDYDWLCVSETNKYLDFLMKLPALMASTNQPFLFVHGSPEHPIDDYVEFPPPDALKAEYGESNPKWKKTNTILENLIGSYDVFFCGHTHFPGVLKKPKKGYYGFFVHRGPGPDKNEETISINTYGEVASCNPGSVGQPRDRDPRASYMIVDVFNNTVMATIVRVGYDVEKTRQKIHDTPELDNILGDRLLEGK